MEEIKPARPIRKPKNPLSPSKAVPTPAIAETLPAESAAQPTAPVSGAEIAKTAPINQPEVAELTKVEPVSQPELPAVAAAEIAKTEPATQPELPVVVAKAKLVKQPEVTMPAANLAGDWRQTWGLPPVEGKTARELAAENLTQKKLEAKPEIKIAPEPQAEPEKTVASNPIVAEVAKPEKESSAANNDFVEAEAPAGAETTGTFKSFLIPYVLLLLRDGAIHGYAIWERLMLMSIPGLNENDRVNIYRALRQLEKEGKIKSQWETTGTGPARRVYMLTNTGENFLKIWATGLRQYRQSLDFFFNLYTGGTLPNLLGNGLFAPVNHKTEGEK